MHAKLSELEDGIIELNDQNLALEGKYKNCLLLLEELGSRNSRLEQELEQANSMLGDLRELCEELKG